MQRVNLIPDDIQDVRKFARKRQKNFFMGVLGFVLLSMFFYKQHQTVEFYESEIITQRKNIKVLEENFNQASNLSDQKKEQKKKIRGEKKIVAQRLAALQEAKRNENFWSHLLMELSDTAPEEIWFKKLAFNEKFITIEGQSSENKFVSEFMARLDANPFLKQTNFKYMKKENFENKSTVNFKIVTYLGSDQK